MKKIVTLIMLVSVFSLVVTADLEARGGRGGRGGGHRGGQRMSGRSMHRSPSMSRSTSHRQPSRRQTPRPQRKKRVSPKTQPRAARPSRPTTRPTDSRGFVEGRTPTRSNLQQFIKKSPRSGDGLRSERKDKFKRDRSQRAERRNETSGNIRDNIRDKFPGRGDWFQDDFWNRHDYDPGYSIGDRNAWKSATWAGMNRWADWGWGTPYYYDYDDTGDGADDDGSYAYSEEDYTEQVGEITTTTQDQQDADWISLGIYALAKDRKSIETPNVYMQLALNKEGNLAGTFYNTTTDNTYALEGVVDKESQRAAWMMSNSKNAPILQTGIYNLTKDETPVRITFADGSTQNWLMVRLQEPKG